MKKEFSYDFAEMDEFFTSIYTSKKIELEKNHDKTIIEEIRLSNLTDKKLTITIEEHDLLKHPKKVVLKPKEIQLVELKIPCKKVEKLHKSELILKSKNQISKVPVRIKHN